VPTFKPVPVAPVRSYQSWSRCRLSYSSTVLYCCYSSGRKTPDPGTAVAGTVETPPLVVLCIITIIDNTHAGLFRRLRYTHINQTKSTNILGAGRSRFVQLLAPLPVLSAPLFFSLTTATVTVLCERCYQGPPLFAINPVLAVRFPG